MALMDDETFRALHVILNDHFCEDPAGSHGTGIGDLEQLNDAYETVARWYQLQGND
jgi:hypothetical protein